MAIGSRGRPGHSYQPTDGGTRHFRASVTYGTSSARRTCGGEFQGSILYPWALKLVDPLHTYFGAFEETVKADEDYEVLENAYTHIAHFLGDVDLLGRLIEVVKDRLTAYGEGLLRSWRAPHPFNWKWQYLIRFTKPLCSILPTLTVVYDPQLVATGVDSMLPRRKQFIWDFGRAISMTKNLLGKSMALLGLSIVLTHEAMWFDG